MVLDEIEAGAAPLHRGRLRGLRAPRSFQADEARVRAQDVRERPALSPRLDRNVDLPAARHAAVPRLQAEAAELRKQEEENAIEGKRLQRLAEEVARRREEMERMASSASQEFAHAKADLSRDVQRGTRLVMEERQRAEQQPPQAQTGEV